MNNNKEIAKKLHQNAIVVDANQEIWDDYTNSVLAGKPKSFTNIYLPKLREAGINVLNLVIGGDHTAQPIASASDFHFWDTNKFIDLLLMDKESGDESFEICTTADMIDDCIKNHKIALVLKVNGGKVFEGEKKNVFLLSSLRNLYRLGLRSAQLTGNNRNKLADGAGQECTKGGITRFGVEVIQEMERLGMIIDFAQLSEYGFWDAIKYTTKPFIDSHSCARSLSDHPRNMSDERIIEMGKRKCVIGVSFWAELVNKDKQAPDMEDLMKQIDHIVKLAGIDCVALGPDFSGFMWPENWIGFMNLGPDGAGKFVSTKPTKREKYPNYIEGLFYGDRENDYVVDVDVMEKLGLVTEALLDHGYSEEDVQKILGGNMMRIYHEILK